MAKRLFWGWILVALSSVSLSCDGGTRIEGRVRNKAGAYLPDVTITLNVGARERRVRTDAEGRYRISMTHSPFNVEEKLSFESPGYLQHQMTFRSHDGLHELDVTLLPSSATTQNN